MIRVLHIFHVMGNGGIEHYVMDRYRLIDKNKIQFDFLITSEAAGYFDAEIEKLGGRIYHTVNFSRHPLRSLWQTAKIVRKNHYDIVHRHTGNAIAYADLLAAKIGGAKHLIIHSHNNSAGKNLLHILFKNFLSLDCIRLACSRSAGEWLFGNKTFTIFKNAIDTSKYLYDEERRKKYRQQYGIPSDAFVVGHIGRFSLQKNHDFLIDVFAEIAKKLPHAFLMCVGDGELRSTIEAKLKRLNLCEKVVFTGSIGNVHDVINCFDIFCFPSKYEGLGITLIEAQSNGLKCYASKDRIPGEADVSGNVTFLPLDAGADFWAEKICAADHTRDLDAVERVVSAGYDLGRSVKELEDFYMSLKQ